MEESRQMTTALKNSLEKVNWLSWPAPTCPSGEFSYQIKTPFHRDVETIGLQENRFHGMALNQLTLPQPLKKSLRLRISNCESRNRSSVGRLFQSQSPQTKRTFEENGQNLVIGCCYCGFNNHSQDAAPLQVRTFTQDVKCSSHESCIKSHHQSSSLRTEPLLPVNE